MSLRRKVVSLESAVERLEKQVKVLSCEHCYCKQPTMAGRWIPVTDGYPYYIGDGFGDNTIKILDKALQDMQECCKCEHLTKKEVKKK